MWAGRVTPRGQTGARCGGFATRPTLPLSFWPRSTGWSASRVADSCCRPTRCSRRSPELSELHDYPLIEALMRRRSRRFAPGMALDGGPLSYESREPPAPLTIDEQAALAFAACGITGHTLAELPY